LSHAAAPRPAEDDGRRALVLRVAASRPFTKAPQLRDILLYICQRALADPAASIREYEIGYHALGRKAGYNPHDDNIVRVQISHLRRKLEEYFATDGKDEPVRITVPKGAYVPRFEPRAAATPDAARAGADAALPDRAWDRRPPPWILILSISTALLAVTCLYLFLRPWTPHAATQNMTPHTPRQDPFWSRVFGGGQPVAVVVADTCLVMLQDILHTDISVADYISRQYQIELLQKVGDKGLRSALQLIAGRQYTSLADINVASKLVELSREFGPTRAPIRYARHLNIRDFKTDNMVIIGSRRGVPWVQLFEPQLNFSIEEDRSTHGFHVRNKSPKAGEQPVYVPTESGGSTETYAVVALLPNLGNTGSVLMLSGITMEGTEAAGEMVAGNDFSKELARMLGPQAVRERYFEILLRTRTVAGTARNSQIAASRVIEPGENGN
jgi:hypothetical protein